MRSLSASQTLLEMYEHAHALTVHVSAPFTLSIHTRGKRKSGEEFPMRVFVLNISDDAQQQAALLVFAEDLTSTLQREARLRVSYTAAQVCHLGLVCVNASSVVELFSEQATAMFGYF
uniref:Hybrid signal transduction histidine kinase F n=1 Tax=Lygus hesperus TaxID=30085 RepID=A0A0A9WWA2_LYGHE